MADLEGATTDLLQRLLRFNTVNPPGNELPAQEMLAALLSGAGFEVELLGRSPSRPTSSPACAARPTARRCACSRTSTRSRSPRSGSTTPGPATSSTAALWGRGALDMKSQTAAEVAAGISLARAGWRPAAGDLLVVVLVDEETGGAEGAQWLCDEHPDKVRCDCSSTRAPAPSSPSTAGASTASASREKGVFRFTVARTASPATRPCRRSATTRC